MRPLPAGGSGGADPLPLAPAMTAPTATDGTASAPAARSRKSSDSDVVGGGGAGGPTAFFLASESEMEERIRREEEGEEGREHGRRGGEEGSERGVGGGGKGRGEDEGVGKDSSYGVQSLDDALQEVFGEEIVANAKREEDGVGTPGQTEDAEETHGQDHARDQTTRTARLSPPLDRPKSSISTSNPLTPLPLPSNTKDHTDISPPHNHSPSRVHHHTQVRSGPILQHIRRASLATAASSSRPLTPLRIESPLAAAPDAAAGTPSSVSLRSFGLEDDADMSGLEDSASQAIASSSSSEVGQGDEGPDGEEVGVEMARKRTILGSFVLGEQDGGGDDEDDGMPQLVMPSIKMPSRRPFTAKGKGMGRLKVMVAGEAGVGKTSLIRSIFQTCEDIVHVDPLSTISATVPSAAALAQTTTASPGRRSRRRKSELRTARISEIWASTRAYPAWWSDMDESGTVLRRRKSVGDTVLERNLCFVDTPGYGRTRKSLAEEIEPVVGFMEELMAKNAAVMALGDADVLSVLSGNGGMHVDVVFYLLGYQNDLAKDVEYIRRLSDLTNVIPLISKSDTIQPAALKEFRRSVLQALDAASVKPFLFGRGIEDLLQMIEGQSNSRPTSRSPSRMHQRTPSTTLPSNPSDAPPGSSSPHPPFAISSMPGSDADIMDASLLMSPDYVTPLVPSELSTLVESVFDPETISWLRHAAVKKFLSWRMRKLQEQAALGLHHDLGLLSQQPPRPFSDKSRASNRSSTSSSSRQSSSPSIHTSPSVSAMSFLSSPSPGVLIPRPDWDPLSLASASPLLMPSSPVPSSGAGAGGAGTAAFRSSLNEYCPNNGLPQVSPPPSSSGAFQHEVASSTAIARLSAADAHGHYEASCAQHNGDSGGVANARLAGWAADLQRALANERARFATLTQGAERRRWVVDWVGEELGSAAGAVSGQHVLPDGAFPPAHWALVQQSAGGRQQQHQHQPRKLRSGSQSSSRDAAGPSSSSSLPAAAAGYPPRTTTTLLDPRDPLRLCALADGLRRRARLAARILGGAGMLGAAIAIVAVPVIRGWWWPSAHRGVDGAAGGGNAGFFATAVPPSQPPSLSTTFTGLGSSAGEAAKAVAAGAGSVSAAAAAAVAGGLGKGEIGQGGGGLGGDGEREGWKFCWRWLGLGWLFGGKE
ncbi:hypothetical protein BDY21DRAFT_368610 [Lineolata rhizophorae]|uniref:Septin-type G domain-containing protein n=1 Tax=Lineolata rhizophorae TaxID=578093 RepID=A0A6A6PBN6_9PEZI|nr:hypothetical protein BDY21DRAFT_368610 [Lineolata rhizophorae]